jgi:O-antigen/teichoic acid export membrane protein
MTSNEIETASLAALASPESLPVGERTPPSNSRLLAQFGSGALGFVAAKATVFLLPLILSRSWSLHDYGLFEYALAWGTLVAVPLGVGMSGAIPYFLLKKGMSDYLSAFRLHSLLMGAFLFFMTLAYLSIGFNLTVYVTGFISGVLVIQSIRSTLCKVNEAPARASVLESGIYVFLFILVVLLWLMKIRFSFPLFVVGLNVYGLLLVLSSLRGFRWAEGRDLKLYRQTVEFGIPLILTSASIIFLVSSTRLLAGKLFSMEAVGIYSFFFRLTSPVILVHSLLTTIYFRRLYEAEQRALDRYFCLILTGILCLSLVLLAIIPKLLVPYFPLLERLRQHFGIYLVLSIQMVFWTAIALAEVIIYRQEQARKFAVVLVGTIGALLLLIMLFKINGILNLLTISQLQMSSMYLAFLGQMYLLRESGVRLFKTSLFATCVFGLYWLTFSLLG